MAMLKYFKFPFATSGDKTAIPDTVQPGGEVSYPQGFGPDYELDPGVFPAAKDVPRDETNQLYFDITNALKEYQEFGTPDFISSAMNGGSPFSYAKFARVKYTDDKIYVSKKNANTSLPSVAADWYQSSQDAEFLSITATAFEASVTDGEVVYWDFANNRFDEAIADGTSKQNAVGFADVTNGRVYVYGFVPGLVSGLAGNTEYFLSTATPGALTSVKPATNIVSMGYAKSATDFFVEPSRNSVLGYLLLTGGTITGTLNVQGTTTTFGNAAGSQIRITAVAGGGGNWALGDGIGAANGTAVFYDVVNSKQAFKYTNAGGWEFLTNNTKRLGIDAAGTISVDMKDTAVLYDQKANTTNGGTFTNGAWRTRDLNAENDPSGLVTLSGNQFTLGAGKYEITWNAPAFRVGRNISRLQNITDAATVEYGSNAFSSNTTSATPNSIGSTVVNLAASKTFEIQHICETSVTTEGFGPAASLGVTETYTTVRIRRISNL